MRSKKLAHSYKTEPAAPSEVRLPKHSWGNGPAKKQRRFAELHPQMPWTKSVNSLWKDLLCVAELQSFCIRCILLTDLEGFAEWTSALADTRDPCLRDVGSAGMSWGLAHKRAFVEITIYVRC